MMARMLFNISSMNGITSRLCTCVCVCVCVCEDGWRAVQSHVIPLQQRQVIFFVPGRNVFCTSEQS